MQNARKLKYRLVLATLVALADERGRIMAKRKEIAELLIANNIIPDEYDFVRLLSELCKKHCTYHKLNKESKDKVIRLGPHYCLRLTNFDSIEEEISDLPKLPFEVEIIKEKVNHIKQVANRKK